LFPNAQAGALAVRPVKGTAALFYNLLPDGNGDISSLHQALPIKKGEKWLANMYV
jgi:prolyl 4-hydroxylase